MCRKGSVAVSAHGGDNFAYGATGGAGIALRGLSEKYTLVLVDGQRVAPYGFPSNGTDTFVDLNAIRYVRVVDIVGDGSTADSFGRPIFDPHPSSPAAGT